MYKNFINLPVVRVKKTNASDKYLYDLFINQDKRNIAWERKCLEAFYSGNMDALYTLTKDKPVNFETYLIDSLISSYGSEDDKTYQYLLSIFNDELIKSVKKIETTNNLLIIHTTKGIIKCKRFSDVNNELTKIFPNITNKESRQKQCHNLSIKLTMNANFNCKLATSYISSFSDHARYLHSWVEAEIDKQNLVFDLTRNIIVNREGYYFFQNIDGPIYKIPQTTLIKERDTFNKIATMSGPLAKLYLANRPLALSIYKDRTRDNKQEK